MTQGLSLHIGLNSVDPTHYDGWPGQLRACEADANSMRAIADSQGFRSITLLTQQATADRVKAEISNAAQRLVSEDVFLISYSGHGGQVPDTNGGDEDDGLDETWVLYDRMLIDDELYSLWAGFKPGVRIVVLSDSCHSGTVLKEMITPKNVTGLFRSLGLSDYAGDDEADESKLFRAMPLDVQERTYRNHQRLYDEIQKNTPVGDRTAIESSVILISGCQDNQLSLDGIQNGLFTGTLLQVWDNGNFAGGYSQFHQAIKRRMPPVQTPNLFIVGAQSASFEASKPFTTGDRPLQPSVPLGPATPAVTPPVIGQNSRKKRRVSINIRIT
jgi:hypothetical protein